MSFTANSIGGEYAHQLTVDELPSHTHTLDIVFSASNMGTSYTATPWSTCVIDAHKNGQSELNLYHTENGKSYAGMYTYSNGNNKTHNNIQSYVVTYFWRRTK